MIRLSPGETALRLLFLLRLSLAGLAVVIMIAALLFWAYRRGKIRKQLFGIFFTLSILIMVGLGFLMKNNLDELYASQYPNCKPGYPCTVEEDEGKKKVADRPEVLALAEKYGWPHVHVQALDIADINDRAFLAKVSPLFADDTGCIILVNAGSGEGYVYKEDEEGKLAIVSVMTLEEFLNATKNVDSLTMARFYLSLR